MIMAVTKSDRAYLVRVLKWGIIALLILMPIQAVIVTWIRSLSPSLDIVLAWKELLLGVLCIPALLLVSSDPKLQTYLKRSPIIRLIALFSGLHLALWIAHSDEPLARLTGVAFNLRFLVVFVLATIVVFYEKIEVSKLVRILLVPASIVVIFGTLQAVILPHDVLRHVGYGNDTIRPYLTVNEQRPDLVRINSTLRGPNPLGAYLLVPLGVVATFLLARKKTSGLSQKQLGAFMILGLLTLSATYSRSAWIGAASMLAVTAWVVMNGRLTKRSVVSIGAVMLLVGAVGITVRNNHYVQNLIFHTDSSINRPSSNQGHLQAFRTGLDDIVSHPLGRGPGVAGPAARRLAFTNPSTSENYYLQLGQEVGILGILIFAGIILLVGLSLWMRRDNPLALGLCASLIGLSVVGLFLHVWADEDVAYIWWGLAGFAMVLPRTSSGGILKTSWTKSKQSVRRRSSVNS